MLPTFRLRLHSLALALCAAGSLGATAAWSQVTWTTTKTTNGTRNTGAAALLDGKLRVKVFPGYLDVEEEVTIQVQGSVSPSNDASTLEIRGAFTLPAGAVVTGALLWDGDRVLQAKLLDNVKADSIYEDLVDRDSVPPPRPVDPLILSRTAANGYLVKVYPVALNGSRRLRIRYQLPPRVGAEGFEMRLQGALTPLFGTQNIYTSLEPAPGVSTIRYAEGGIQREMTLPRALFIARGSLASDASSNTALRILPRDPLRQVQVKTSFDAGPFKGHYLNLYAGIDSAMLDAVGQRVEVVFFWKWNAPQDWKTRTFYIGNARRQAEALYYAYGNLGLPGNRVGLLHDDSEKRHVFPVSSQGDTGYTQARAYLKALLSGNGIKNRVDSMKTSGPGGAGGKDDAAASYSRARFLANMQIVKTLYSPEEGVVRHLVLASAGSEILSEDASSALAEFDRLFEDRPPSVGPLSGELFEQVGFDLRQATAAHPLGEKISDGIVEVPALPSVAFYATVRNAAKAYDFKVECPGGRSLLCGVLEFHGKATTPWSDSVEWEAYRSNGKLVKRIKTKPFVMSRTSDTATVQLWAGAAGAFSEMREPALGPAYGFVDFSASLLALVKDTLTGSTLQAYADSGVPRSGSLTYPGPSSIAGLAQGNGADWRVERVGPNVWLLRVPGLAAGARVEIELMRLDGKRVGAWSVIAEAGALRWSAAGIRPGTYLVRVRGANLRGERLLTL